MRIELTTLAWKAKVIPFYDTRINILMHIYDAITNSGLHIHLSMIDEKSFYILVYDFFNYDVTMKFFNNCNTAKEFIQALK